MLMKIGQIELVHRNQSVRATEVLKQANNRNKLFTDAGSPYPTKLGRQKRTEFVIQCPSSGIDWRIECKSRQTLSLIGEVLIELNNVTDIPESKYCLVFNETLNDPYILNQIQTTVDEKNLNDSVWFGTKAEFKKLLKQAMK